MKNKIQGLKTIVLVVFVAVLLFVKPNFYLLSPGSAQDLKDFVSVPEAAGEDEGTFMLVTVSQRLATWPLLIYGLLHPAVEVIPLRSVIPPGMDQQKYNELMQLWMEESQALAKTLALRRAGYAVPIESEGVLVVEVLPDSPVREVLLPNDIIKEIDGERVTVTDEFISLLQKRNPGEEVALSFERNGEILRETFTTVTHTTEEDKAALRILVRTLWQPNLPLDIEINTGGISGPSAGMMFVLEILNQLEPQDITGGKKIAGTGTVDLNEEIGAIGGVKQKVIAAEASGAEIFLVPEENYDEALKTAKKIKVVAVKNLQEVLDYLKTLEEETSWREGEKLNSQGAHQEILPAFSCSRIGIQEIVKVLSPDIQL
ncbi:MAG TPA: PDZ domain-containing protein [Firmicutes bacterium]|nr:PDZ domain-containing protein [Bacillota bacterium]